MISTHILDTSLGKPASNVNVILEKQTGSDWIQIKSDTTNPDGRIRFECDPIAGNYRLTFDVVSYFKKQGLESFFLAIPVAFQIIDLNRTYHVPLLLNPFGFSTYRGS